MGIPERPDWDDRDEEHFELVLPFTQVASVGGPYDDDSFTAGFQMGQIYGKLENRHIAAATYLIYTRLVDQVDLIAMKHGYRMDILHPDEEWTQVGVTRIDTTMEDLSGN